MRRSINKARREYAKGETIKCSTPEEMQQYFDSFTNTNLTNQTNKETTTFDRFVRFVFVIYLRLETNTFVRFGRLTYCLQMSRLNIAGTSSALCSLLHLFVFVIKDQNPLSIPSIPLPSLFGAIAR